MARIPAACRIEPPIPHLDCPTPPAIPADACIVEQLDLERATVVDRFVFDRGQLIRLDTRSSSNTDTVVLFDYDTAGRQLHKTTCLTSSGGDPSWELSWRQPFARYDGPFASVEREQRLYSTARRVPTFGDVVTTSRFDGKVVSTDMRMCYAFDNRERRTDRFQVYRMSDRPGAFDSVINHYEYPALGPDAGSKVGAREITHSTLNLDRRPDGSFGVRFEMAWTAHFTHDNRGFEITRAADSDAPTKLEYDARGRLASYSGIHIAWEADRIVAITGIGTGYDRTYHYDAAGRLTDVLYGPNRGYHVTYGPRCPRDFRHPEIAPNIDNYLYYEGRDTL